MCTSVFIADYYFVQPEITTHQFLGGIIVIVLLTVIWELFSDKENSGQNISATMAGILFVPILLGTAIDIRQFDSLMGTQLTLALVLSVLTSVCCYNCGYYLFLSLIICYFFTVIFTNITTPS